MNLHQLSKMGQAEKKPIWPDSVSQRRPRESTCITLFWKLLGCRQAPHPTSSHASTALFACAGNTSKSTLQSVRRLWHIRSLLKFWHKSFLSSGHLQAPEQQGDICSQCLFSAGEDREDILLGSQPPQKTGQLVSVKSCAQVCCSFLLPPPQHDTGNGSLPSPDTIWIQGLS